MSGRGSRRFPPNRGVQWSNTLESTLWGMELGVRIVLGLAEIVLAGGVVVAGVWSSLYGAVAFGGPCGLGSCTHQQ